MMSQKKKKIKTGLDVKEVVQKFYKALELPEQLKTDDIDAELKDGILTLKLPKVEPKPEHKPKKVKIK
jgi:HSP20 family molecular chaperone IbpA